MRIKILTLCLLIAATVSAIVSPIVFAERVAVLPELMNPRVIRADRKNFYVTEKTAIYIYSLKDFKLIKKFGTAGEGPGEFKGTLFVEPLSDSLLVNCHGRVIYFTKTGKYLKESRSPQGPMSGGFMPLGENFAGMTAVREKKEVYSTFNLYDSKLNKIKEVHRFPIKTTVNKKMNPLAIRLYRFDGKTHNDLLYIGDHAKGTINVFDKQGKKVRTITYPFKDLEVTDQQVKEMEENLKLNPGTKEFYEMFKDQIRFPEIYPKYYDFFVDDNIYVLTYERKENQAQFIVLDKKGIFVKKILLPFYQTNMHVTYPHTISSGKLYQLVENEDEEEWELHITKIK